ncbi:MAG TPA: FtsX-like permease family protein, partial [Opitutaceae bacterium]
SYFNGDPNVIGRTFLNDSLTTTVIGVLPRDFHFLSSDAEFLRPTSHAPADRGPQNLHNNNYTMIARLAPSATAENLQAEVDAFNAQQVSRDPFAAMVKTANYHTNVRPLHADHIRAVKPILLLLQCGVLFLLLIGCVNLVNLLLIRASHRTKEYAIRQALGARTEHIATEVLAETALLAIGGSLYGMLEGVLGIDFLHTLGTDRLPLGAQIHLDGRVAITALVIAVIVAVALAVPILSYVLRMKMAAGLQTESRSGTASRGAQRLRHFFIVAQVALAFVLLSSAGLLTISLHRVLSTSPGFETEKVMTGHISMPWKNYQTPEARAAFLNRLVPALKSIPGVTGVAYSNGLPFTSTNDSAVSIQGRPLTPGEPIRAHFICAVSQDYWNVMGIPLLKGRLLSDNDSQAPAPVCVVDRAFADYYWPNGDAIGHQVFFGPPPDKNAKYTTIVGVVNSVTQRELTEGKAHGTVFLPYATNAIPFVYLVLRSALPSDTVAVSVRKTIMDLDPELPLNDWKVMQQRIDDSLIARRSPTILAAIFAGAALLLAALGTYGVLSYAVAQREAEIGVRIALGAQPAQIRWQFLALGMRLLAIGAVIGLVLAWIAGNAMHSVLFESTGFHIDIFLVTFFVMTLVSLAACVLPARRATKVDPSSSVRA